jgi:hypothetical protein
MPSAVERISVVETQVINLAEKIDDIKTDVKVNHEDIKLQLKTMYDASCTQHAELAKKLGEVEQFKNKWIYLVTGGSVVVAFVLSHLDSIKTFLS